MTYDARRPRPAIRLALVHTRPVGIRPSIELEPTDHPLAVEHRNGITLDRVREIAELLHHHEKKL